MMIGPAPKDPLKRSGMHPTVTVETPLTLDRTLKHLLPANMVFQLPSDNKFTVRDIIEFSVDGNPFEWWRLDGYSVIIDKSENTIYFMQDYAKRQLSDNERVFTDDSICLDRDKGTYRFNDFSGLIETRIGGRQALLRVYSRENGDTTEYVIGTLVAEPRHHMVEYLVGITLASVSQLGVL